jgi:AcrR family transcriptional regulator
VTAQETHEPVRWRRRKEARPAEILSAALACFAERGFAATRLDDVAARAGITKGTLYLYFRNKEELFKAVVRQEVVANIARAETRLAQSAEQPTMALLERLLADWTERAAMPQSAIPKLILTEAGNFPELARFYLDEVIHRAKALFRALLKRGIAHGEFRAVDIDSAIHCIVAPIMLAMLWRHSFETHERRTLDLAQLCRTHVALVERGLMQPRRAAARRRRKRGAR